MENTNKINVLGVNFDNITMNEAVEKCNEFLLTEFNKQLNNNSNSKPFSF